MPGFYSSELQDQPRENAVAYVVNKHLFQEIFGLPQYAKITEPRDAGSCRWRGGDLNFQFSAKNKNNFTPS
jgi:hypothetical protein